MGQERAQRAGSRRRTGGRESGAALVLVQQEQDCPLQLQLPAAAFQGPSGGQSEARRLTPHTRTRRSHLAPGRLQPARATLVLLLLALAQGRQARQLGAQRMRPPMEGSGELKPEEVQGGPFWDAR